MGGDLWVEEKVPAKMRRELIQKGGRERKEELERRGGDFLG